METDPVPLSDSSATSSCPTRSAHIRGNIESNMWDDRLREETSVFFFWRPFKASNNTLAFLFMSFTSEPAENKWHKCRIIVCFLFKKQASRPPHMKGHGENSIWEPERRQYLKISQKYMRTPSSRWITETQLKHMMKKKQKKKKEKKKEKKKSWTETRDGPTARITLTPSGDFSELHPITN